MFPVTCSVLSDVGLFLCTVAAVLYAAAWWLYSYWERRGVPYLQPESIFGNFKNILLGRKNFGQGVQELYQRLEPHPFGRVFISLRPAIMFRDPDLFKSVLIKDFQCFQHRGLKVDEERDPLSAHLFNLGGPRWKILRSKMTPTFSSGKMKMMFPLMEGCSRELQSALEPMARDGATVDVKDWNARFTTDVIGTCAFGLQCNSIKDPDSEFRTMSRNIFKQSFRAIFNFILVKTGRLFNVKFTSPELERFFMDVVKQTVDYRRLNKVTRNDFVQLLMQLQDRGHVDDDHADSNDHKHAAEKSLKQHSDAGDDFVLTNGLFAAQCFVFFIAGFETSSTTMTFCLYELANNPDVQQRLYEEIERVLKKHDGKMSYEAIQEMTYLDMVISETLRKYPPVANLARLCTSPYTIPGSDVTLQEDTKVIIPLFAIQRDPKYYPDPEKFDPERFTEEEKAARHPFVYMPFGEGPRICIGMRFGLLQAKVGIVAQLSKFEISPLSKATGPITFDPHSATLSPLGGVNLRIKARAK